MRLPTLPPHQLDHDQRALFDDMSKTLGTELTGFVARDQSGALIGPFNAWLHAPKWGRPIWDVVQSVAVAPTLPRNLREIAILVTGAHFRSAYEIYAHVIVAENRGLDDAKIATIISGERPGNLTPDEAIAYDVASALVNGHVLPDLTYRHAADALGETSVWELIYLVGAYCMVSVTLNGFDVQVPDQTP